MQCRRLSAAFGVVAAVCFLADAAGAQTAHRRRAAAVMLPASSVPSDPMATPSLVVEDPSREVPQHRRPHRALLISGLVVLGGSYGASAVVGAKSDRGADENLLLPVVGPWLDLKSRDCGVKVCDNEGVNKALLISDGALQGLSALSILLSFIIPEPREPPWYAVGSQKFYVAPQFGRVNGLSAAGEF
jgi:hypothetical protein